MSDSLVNFSHLDRLSEDVVLDGEVVRIIYLYARAPDYEPAADPEEGASCVDDVTRAAVVYLRHHELTGCEASRRKAEGLLRFILLMQTPTGLFHNFVLDNRLEINRTHFRSQADTVEWWTGRAVWALATGARVLKRVNPDLAETCSQAVQRTLPHFERLLERYPRTLEYRGRTLPTWLIGESSPDATSEMLLGLVAYDQALPSVEVQTMIMRFAEGIALMRYGSMNRFPYGLHASNRDGWHLWGNAQTQALAEAGVVTSAKREADHFFPRLLVEGFLHSITFDDLHGIRYYERIAYGVRGVAVGLIRLYEATKDEKYAKMAGLAAAWFTGNNGARMAMYDPATGRCYDGLDAEDRINLNAGAESTIEALYTLVEVEQHPPARRWLHARGGQPTRIERDGMDWLCRVFEDDSHPHRLGLVMNLTQETCDLLEDGDLDRFLDA